MTAAAARHAHRSGRRRSGGALALVLAVAGIGSLFAAPAVASPRVAVKQPLVALLHDHIARTRPSANAGRIEAVAARRPLTRSRTVLPVLDSAENPNGGGTWIRVRLPGRPNGHSGWISSKGTRLTSTEWRIRVDLSARRVVVYRGTDLVRRFRAVVGKPSTPTPRGSFFVEEALALSPYAAGGPFALATSARSRALHEFEGGPGQIAIHGTDNLTGTPGTAVSHGCVRLATHAITWLAHRVGRGVSVTITR